MRYKEAIEEIREYTTDKYISAKSAKALALAIEALELIEWMEERVPSMLRKSRELMKGWSGEE